MIQSKKVVKECEGERVESESVAVAVKVEHSLNITLKDETLIPSLRLAGLRLAVC